MSALLLLLVFFLSGMILMYFIYNGFAIRKTYEERFLQLQNKAKIEASGTSIMPYLLRWLSSIGQWRILAFMKTPELSKKLIQAGWLNKNAMDIFIGTMIFVALLLFVLFLIGLFFIRPQLLQKPLSLLFFLVIFLYCSRSFMQIYLDRYKKNYTRIIVRELVDFFELYIINISSGKSSLDALKDTLALIEDLYPRVAKQIHYLLGELQTLATYDEVWENLAQRIDDQEIKNTIKVLRHCNELGLPVERDLAVQINQIRQIQLSKIEEKIMRLSTTMLFPMFLFIFPCMFVIVLAPVIFNGLHIMNSL